MWKRADQVEPTGGASPVDYGWKLTQNCLEPDWYPGRAVPESLTAPPTGEDIERASTDDEESDNARSEDSDDDDGSDDGDDSYGEDM